jgi:hypothetical protein
VPLVWRYLPLRDDIASTAWWYQNDPDGVAAASFDPDVLEIV